MKSPVWVGLVAGSAACGGLLALPGAEQEFVRYTTTLEGRTKGQRHNAIRSAARIDGAVIPPRGVFSFNERVGTFTQDQGYRKAPVSYNGQLITTWGGGVCQTSSTLYNAALAAGMRIVERHAHQFAPAYVPPGRDAAVAYRNIDLRFLNPYDFPVRIRARVRDRRLEVAFASAHMPKVLPSVVADVRRVEEPLTLAVLPSSARGTPGKAGFEVVVYRVWPDRKERVSKNHYPPMHRLRAER